MAFVDYERARLPANEMSTRAQIARTAVIDEWWDVHVNRPLAGLLVRIVAPTALTANQLTVLSGLCGVGAALCLARAHGGWPILAGVMLFLAMIFDCADGQLARLRGGGHGSFIGRMMDGYADWITAVALHLGLWGYLHAHGFQVFGRELTGAFSTFLVALVAGASMAIHSMLYDYFKNRYQAQTGDGPADTHTPEEVRERILGARSAGERLYLWLYWLYCKTQTSLANDDDHDDDTFDPAVVAVRRHYLGRGLRFWGGAGPTLHLVTFAFSAILAGYVWWGLYVYLAYSIIVANLVTVFMVFKTRQLDAQMHAELTRL